MSRPEPRPALKRAEDGTVHPAAPRASAEQHLHPVPHAPAAATSPDESSDQRAQGPRHAGFTGKAVELTAKVPKDLRKAVRRRAQRDNRSVDQVVVDALTRHVQQ